MRVLFESTLVGAWELPVESASQRVQREFLISIKRKFLVTEWGILLGEKNRIKDALEFISSVKGIKKLKLLSKQEKEEVLRYEREAEKRCLMGLMPGVNQGVREAVSRTYTVAALTTDEFEWPKKGTI